MSSPPHQQPRCTMLEAMFTKFIDFCGRLASSSFEHVVDRASIIILVHADVNAYQRNVFNNEIQA